MKRRFVLSALPAALLALTAATKPRKAAKAPPPPPLGDLVLVELQTEFGPIVLELDHKHAPLTVEHFMRLVDSGRLNGMEFYRSLHFGWGQEPNGLVQGGLQYVPQTQPVPNVPHEPTSLTGLTHKAGTVSLARNAPGTGRGEFFIMLADSPSFDADPKSASPDAQAGYAAFGRVVSGMEIARRIYDAPLSAKAEGMFKGQLLEPRIKVPRVRRALAPPAPPPA